MTRLAKFALAAAIPAAVFISPAMAEMMSSMTTLSAAEEVPPAKSTGSGTLDVTYDGASKKLSWKGAFKGLTGAPTAAHFHGPAAAGMKAGVEFPATVTASPFEGTATLTDAQAADLAAGKLYFNIHTAANPDGEIRGQVMMK